MADLFKLLQPLQFMQTFLKKGARVDGRKFDQFRDILLTTECITTANGSALVKLGTSSVICGINTSLVKPSTDQPDKGILDVAVKFSNTCSTDFDNPDRTTICDLVRECIKKTIFHASVIDLGELCLIPRKHVWKIELEIICLNLNGSILDLSLVAAICALKYCKLRKYEIDTELDLITATDSYYNLQINCFPVFVTFCLINDNLLVDPVISEEEVSDCLIRLAVDSSVVSNKPDSDAIFFLEVTGSREIEPSTLEQCYHKALHRARFIKQLIDKHTNTTTAAATSSLSAGGNNKAEEIKYEKMETAN